MRKKPIHIVQNSARSLDAYPQEVERTIVASSMGDAGHRENRYLQVAKGFPVSSMLVRFAEPETLRLMVATEGGQEGAEGALP